MEKRTGLLWCPATLRGSLCEQGGQCTQERRREFCRTLSARKSARTCFRGCVASLVPEAPWAFRIFPGTTCARGDAPTPKRQVQWLPSFSDFPSLDPRLQVRTTGHTL